MDIKRALISVSCAFSCSCQILTIARSGRGGKGEERKGEERRGEERGNRYLTLKARYKFGTTEKINIFLFDLRFAVVTCCFFWQKEQEHLKHIGESKRIK